MRYETQATGGKRMTPYCESFKSFDAAWDAAMALIDRRNVRLITVWHGAGDLVASIDVRAGEVEVLGWKSSAP